MRLSRMSIVLISLCVGLLAALLTYKYLIRERTRVAQKARLVTVVIATKPIAARTVIDPTAIGEKALPAATLPPNCATSMDEVIGQVAVSTLMEGEPIARNTVAPRTASLGLAYAVPEGQRAVAVALDPIIGVAGFLKPGDRVDVVATFTVDEIKVTKTVLQDVTLLAIGPEVRPEQEVRTASTKTSRPQEQANATLAVTPTQAEKLILAEAGGRLRLTLRPADDRAIVILPGVRSDALIGTRPATPARSMAAPAPRSNPPAAHTAGIARQSAPNPLPKRTTPPPQPRASDTVQTIRGVQSTTVDVSED
ncbi:MAG: Flp pilus assembly protein CpaB [Armatimonadota bacterium]